MADVSVNKHKTVSEVHFKKEEVSNLLFAAAIKRMEEVPEAIAGRLIQTSTVRKDEFGGYIVDVIVDDTPPKGSMGGMK